MPRNLLRAALLVFLGLTVAGCWDVQEINRRELADAVFLDLTPGGLTRLGCSVHVPGTLLPPYGGTEQQFQKRHYVLYGEGLGLLDAWKDLQTHTSKGVYLGQLLAVVLSENFARSDLRDLVDFLYRRPEINDNVNVLVTKTDPRELLDAKTANNLIPGNYLAEQLENTYKTTLAIPLKLWQLRSIFFNGTGDAYAPYLEPSEGQYRIAGEALFSGGTWAGELSVEETETLALLHGSSSGYLTVPQGRDRLVAFSEVSSRTAVGVKKAGDGRFRFDLRLKVRGALRETRPRNGQVSSGDEKYYNRRVEAYITGRVHALLAKMQSLDSDPIGFGDKVRIKYPKAWKGMDWHRVYPTAIFGVRVDFAFTNTGLVR